MRVWRAKEGKRIPVLLTLPGAKSRLIALPGRATCLLGELDLAPAELVIVVVLDAEVGEAVRVDVHALAGVRQVVLILGAEKGAGKPG